jgi:hypothetical protein
MREGRTPRPIISIPYESQRIAYGYGTRPLTRRTGGGTPTQERMCIKANRDCLVLAERGDRLLAVRTR